MKHPQIPQQLIDFDHMPDGAFVRVKVVALVLGCSIPTVWRKARQGDIPNPVKLSTGVTGWNIGELRQFIKTVLNKAGE